jgi:hypothetical protein
MDNLCTSQIKKGQEMPQLQWEELDFIECLDEIPEVEDNQISHSFKVVQERLTLALKVWQYESVVHIALYDSVTGRLVTEFTLFVRGSVSHEKYQRAEYLMLRDCIVAPSRFHYINAGDVFDIDKWTFGLTVCVYVKPQISVRFFEHTPDDPRKIP